MQLVTILFHRQPSSHKGFDNCLLYSIVLPFNHNKIGLLLQKMQLTKYYQQSMSKTQRSKKFLLPHAEVWKLKDLLSLSYIVLQEGRQLSNQSFTRVHKRQRLWSNSSQTKTSDPSQIKPLLGGGDEFSLIAIKNLSSGKVDGLEAKALSITLPISNNEYFANFSKLFFRGGFSDWTSHKAKHCFRDVLLSMKQCTLNTKSPWQKACYEHTIQGIYLKVLSQRHLADKQPKVSI